MCVLINLLTTRLIKFYRPGNRIAQCQHCISGNAKCWQLRIYGSLFKSPESQCPFLKCTSRCQAAFDATKLRRCSELSHIQYNGTEMGTTHFFRKSGFLRRWELRRLELWSFTSSISIQHFSPRDLQTSSFYRFWWQRIQMGPSECNVILSKWSVTDHRCTQLPIELFLFKIVVSQGCFKAPSCILPPSKLWHHRRCLTIFFQNFSWRTTYGWSYICHIHFCWKTSDKGWLILLTPLPLPWRSNSVSQIDFKLYTSI